MPVPLDPARSIPHFPAPRVRSIPHFPAPRRALCGELQTRRSLPHGTPRRQQRFQPLHSPLFASASNAFIRSPFFLRDAPPSRARAGTKQKNCGAAAKIRLQACKFVTDVLHYRYGRFFPSFAPAALSKPAGRGPVRGPRGRRRGVRRRAAGRAGIPAALAGRRGRAAAAHAGAGRPAARRGGAAGHALPDLVFFCHPYGGWAYVLLWRQQRAGRAVQARTARLAHHGIPRRVHHARLVLRGHRLPDLPGPFLPQQLGGDVRARGGAPRPRPPRAPARPLVGGARLPPGPGRGGLRAGRLFRRRPQRHPPKAPLPAIAGRDVPVPQPGVRGGEQPPLQHRRLPRHRPAAGHGGGVRRPVRRGARAGHARHARRRVLAHRQ